MDPEIQQSEKLEKCYELRRERDGLEYVVFNEDGLKLVVKNYKERYKERHGEETANKIDIEIVKYTCSDGDLKNFLLKKIQNTFSNLPESGTKGLLFLKMQGMDDRKVDHASPFILTRVAGKNLLLCLEGPPNTLTEEITCYYNASYHSSLGITARTSANYRDLQSDHSSCTVLAVSTLKKCLLDDSFIQKVKELAHEGAKKDSRFDRHFKGDIMLGAKETTSGQGKEFIELLSPTKKETYVKSEQIYPGSEERREVSKKLWYMGHKLARLIGIDLSGEISQATQDLFHEIEDRRTESKSKKEAKEQPFTSATISGSTTESYESADNMPKDNDDVKVSGFEALLSREKVVGKTS